MDSVPVEHWLPVVGYEDLYEVSDLGRVRSLGRTVTAMSRWGKTIERYIKPRIMKPWTHRSGHLYIGLAREAHSRHEQVHRLVLEAFVGPSPDGMECLHGNGDPADNRLENLRWGTRASNIEDALRHGTMGGSNRGDFCARGHEYTPENTYMRPNGRQCRQCAREKKRAWRARGCTPPDSTLCKNQLHEMTVENTYVSPQGHRKCRACANATQLASKQRKRTA